MIRSLLNRAKRKIFGASPSPVYQPHYSEVDRTIMARCQPYTMTNAIRVSALLDAVDYIVRRNLPGAFAECGVWRGGSVLAMIFKLQALGVNDRDIYLYDTFEGMTQPGENDTSKFHPPAQEEWDKAEKGGRKLYDHFFNAATFNEASVKQVLLDTGYPAERLHFVRGPVEETIPKVIADKLALVRLDTDWYESTRHELIHLYPRLVSGGILIIDDYGHWEGARIATDEYFSAPDITPILLQRVDYTARLAIKS